MATFTQHWKTHLLYIYYEIVQRTDKKQLKRLGYCVHKIIDYSPAMNMLRYAALTGNTCSL